MERGWIKLWRKLLDSEIFQNEGVLKVAIWALLRANHREVWVPVKTGRVKTVVHLQPAQFIFGRRTAARELKMPPSTFRNRLHFLKKARFMDHQVDHHYSIGSVINWPSYQPDEKKEDRQRDHQRTTKGHRQELKEKITPEVLLSLRERYSDQELIDQCFDAIRSTRKTGKVADSVLVAQLRKWERYPIEQVEAGIRIYLDRDHAGQGKREDYLCGIIRNQTGQTGKGKSWRDDLPDL
jgi:hypothetical protein